MDTFEDIRLKTAEELDDSDKALLKEKWGDLTDEEKEAFKEAVNPEEKKEEKEEAFAFKSKEEFEKAVGERVEQTIEQREKDRKEAEEKAKKPAEERFFPEDYKAKDWNEAAEKMYPQFRERFVKEQQDVSKKTQETLDKINKGFDEEIDTLAGEDKTIPAKGTKDRETFEADLFQIGVDYKGVTTMTDAYKIYKATHGTHGKEEEKEEVGTRQRDLASKVGKSGGEGTEIKARKYSEISRRSMDDLLEEDLEKLGVKR